MYINSAWYIEYYEIVIDLLTASLSMDTPKAFELTLSITDMNHESAYSISELIKGIDVTIWKHGVYLIDIQNAFKT